MGQILSRIEVFNPLLEREAADLVEIQERADGGLTEEGPQLASGFSDISSLEEDEDRRGHPASMNPALAMDQNGPLRGSQEVHIFGQRCRGWQGIHRPAQVVVGNTPLAAHGELFAVPVRLGIGVAQANNGLDPEGLNCLFQAIGGHLARSVEFLGGHDPEIVLDERATGKCCEKCQTNSHFREPGRLRPMHSLCLLHMKRPHASAERYGYLKQESPNHSPATGRKRLPLNSRGGIDTMPAAFSRLRTWRMLGMAKKLRIGFIGAGGISAGHYHRLQATRKAEVVALVDPSAESLARFYKRCEGSEGLPVYQDYREMLQKEELDGALILTPHTLHFEQTSACLDRGLHVLTEKPMVCTIRRAKALIKKARAAKRVLMISYQRHFDPQFRYMREQIAKGALGKIQYVQAIQSQEWLRLTKGTWRQQLAFSGGGQLNDSGSHLIDIVMWVTGLKIREVFSKQDCFATEVDINSTLAMTFDNGALGTMSVVGNAPGWYEDHTIVGSAGAFYLRQGLGLVHQDAHGKPKRIRLCKYAKNPDSNFVDCILGKDVPQTPPDCGLRTIEVTEAAWRSAKTGRPVKVP